MPEDLFDNLTNLTHLGLGRVGQVPEDLFDNLTTLTGLTLGGIDFVPEGLFDNLTSLTSLNLSGSQLRSVPDNLFDNLTNLTNLSLHGSQLSSLPEGLLDNLTNLTRLFLRNNQLSSLPEGLLDNLTNLTRLYLHGNQFSSVPKGLVYNLTNLTNLTLHDNLFDPLPLTISLERVGNDQFKAVAASGAPFQLVVPLSVSGPGAIAEGPATITIPIGSVESAPLTISRTPGTTNSVNVDIGTFPGLPTNHSGYTLVKSGDLPLAFYVAEEGAQGQKGAEGRPGGSGGGQATTDFNGDGITDFVDFFLLVDAYGGTDARFDLDGSGTVDFVDFFQFVDAFEQSGQAKLLALAQELIGLPSQTELQQNWPNPFNSETVISWFLLQPGSLRLEVFSLTGQRVAVLHQGPQKAGVHRVHWNGRDDTGRPMASGVYLYRLVTDKNVQTRKLTLLR